MILAYQLSLAVAALSFGGMMLSRNSHRSSARHWDYIASQLRTELNAGHDLLDRYAPTDAGAPLASRIASLADRARRRSAADMLLAQRQADNLDAYAAGGQI